MESSIMSASWKTKLLLIILTCTAPNWGVPSGSVVKNLSVIQETKESQFQSPGQEDSLE